MLTLRAEINGHEVVVRTTPIELQTRDAYSTVLIEFDERITIDGEPATRQDVADLVGATLLDDGSVFWP